MNVHLEQFVNSTAWQRDLYRRYGEYPSEEHLPPPVEYCKRSGVKKPLLVYFVQAHDGPIKIGVGADIQRRMTNLQVSHAYPLKLLAVCHGGLDAEYRYHHRFRAHRLNGEWFSPHPDILAEIERIHRAQKMVEEASGERGEQTSDTQTVANHPLKEAENRDSI